VFYIYVICETARHWTYAKKALRPICDAVSQDADEEGILTLSRLPTPTEAETIRHCAPTLTPTLTR
jgi:hypothetical protein